VCTAEVESRGDIRPLDELLKRKLLINGIHLVDRLYIDNMFLSKLSQCITWPQSVHLGHVTQHRDRNEKLLDFLTRRSIAHFYKFVNILEKEHKFLVPFMINDGGQLITNVMSSGRP